MEANVFGDYDRKSSDFLKETLNREGFRLTSQRQKILDLFKQDTRDHHLSAEEIHQLLAQQGESISMSTVYRALHMMVNLGLLQELELAEERKYYELRSPVVSQHHHLVCVHCGEVNEFEDTMIKQVSDLETQSRGFSLFNSQFTVYGICLGCQGSYRRS
jgi:Fur family transcriptional regulator, ferric uptake regulator